MALFNYPSRSSYSAKAAQFVIAAIIVLIASIMIHRGPTHARHMVNNVWYLDLLGAGAVTMAIVVSSDLSKRVESRRLMFLPHPAPRSRLLDNVFDGTARSFLPGSKTAAPSWMGHPQRLPASQVDYCNSSHGNFV